MTPDSLFWSGKEPGPRLVMFRGLVMVRGLVMFGGLPFALRANSPQQVMHHSPQPRPSLPPFVGSAAVRRPRRRRRFPQARVRVQARALAPGAWLA